MLKKENRLGNFRLSNARQINTKNFSLKFSPNGWEINRFAFVVSKKIDSRAVGRNALKRKVRSCIEEIFDNIKKGNDFIFYPKYQAKTSPRSKILEEIKDTFKKEQLL